jgi:hypothetical protein
LDLSVESSKRDNDLIADDLFLFVSHVSEDRSAALEIVGELERRGFRCWIAPRNVRPGKPFDDEIGPSQVDPGAGKRAEYYRGDQNKLYPSKVEAQLREQINPALEQKRGELHTKDKDAYRASSTAAEGPILLNALKSLLLFWKPIKTLKEANSLILISVVYFAIIAASAWISLVFGLGSDILWMPDHAIKNVYYLMYLSPGSITELYTHYAVTAGLFTACALGLYLRFKIAGILVCVLMFLVLVVSLEELLRWQPISFFAPFLYSTVGLLLGIGSVRAMFSFPKQPNRRRQALD